jgi:formylglycine-generating enzyme required for sulfatase activity
LGLNLYAGLSITGAVGTTCQIQFVTNLAQTSAWLRLTNLTLASSPQLWVDTTCPAMGRRFYRVLEVVTTLAPTNMVWIAPGTFVMGSPTNEALRESFGLDESQHVVTISQGFWMGKYLVTQGDYQTLVGRNPSYFTGDLNRPVEQVSWNDATNYCAVRTAQERAAGLIPANYAYRLPTESEWEYACRAGTTTAFYLGSELHSGQANFNGQYEYDAAVGQILNPSGVYVDMTTPVGSYAPNGWGLYDMIGNVWEWCQDWYGTYPAGSVTDPQGAVSGSHRVMRGGSYYFYAQHCRSAQRSRQNPISSSVTTGFRAVLAPAQPTVATKPAPTNVVWIAPGTFVMGSPTNEALRESFGLDESQHVVTISQGFWMEKYLVTQGNYRTVVGSNPSYFTGDLNRPVEQVSWNDATNYCAVRTAQEQAAGLIPANYAYRLPTESEWEYACRAGTTTAFYLGSGLHSGQANFNGQYEYDATVGQIPNPRGVDDDTTTPVGSYAPNGWGLYDMIGNVWEWCQDWYGAYPAGSVTDPQGAVSGSFRVMRGGSYFFYAQHCRSAQRSRYNPSSSGVIIGFRVVLALANP